MNLFWLGAFVLLALMALPVFIVKRQQKASRTQLELNREIFNQRMAELTQQKESGEISAQEFVQLETELQTSLLDDTATPELANSGVGPKSWLIALWLLVSLGAVALYLSVGNYQKVAHWEQALQQMPKLAQKLKSDPRTLTPDELQSFSLALRTKLNEDHSDAMGWLLYGRLQMSFGRSKEALEAFVNALHLEPENRAINLSYAKALALSGDPAKGEQAKQVYQRLLAQQPTDLEVLSQQAFTLFELGDREGAFASWRAMAALLPKDSSRRQQIERTLEMLKNPQKVNPHLAQKAELATQKQPKENSGIQVTIALATEVKLPEQGFLVVFARAVQGNPMPMAVKRMALNSLPVEVTLTAQDAMTEGYKLGSIEPFEVVAKVVKGADVATSETVLEAKSQPLTQSELPTKIKLMLGTASSE